MDGMDNATQMAKSTYWLGRCKMMNKNDAIRVGPSLAPGLCRALSQQCQRKRGHERSDKISSSICDVARALLRREGINVRADPEPKHSLHA